MPLCHGPGGRPAERGRFHSIAQTKDISKFLIPQGLDYCGIKGKLDGDKITWNNGVVWKKLS